jgi:antitoxin component YwqK of YwqJK toxin-antitoxin module
LKKLYSESGKLVAAGHMVEGLREGEWNLYDENGQISATATYKDGRVEGAHSLIYTPDLVGGA